MTTTTPETWTQETDNLWLAGSRVFPRITVAANSEASALELLDERRDWWHAVVAEDAPIA